MNKREFINNKGAVIGGKAWGSFTIHKVEKIPVIYDEEGVIKNDFIAEHPLKDLGAVVLDGKFTGEITGPKIAMRLIGDGSDFLKGGK